ncbi:MAG: exodeoxyribonuclease VII small subunit [Calditrichia bacterium]
MKEKKTFEQAMKRLEEIARSLETGDISLEDSIKTYEEGIKLIEFCQAKLNEAEKKVQKLGRNAEGSLEVTDMERQEQDGD